MRDDGKNEIFALFGQCQVSPPFLFTLNQNPSLGDFYRPKRKAPEWGALTSLFCAFPDPFYWSSSSL